MSDLVLITGTSSGIGLATAIACADRGFRVIATMRNLERREALDRAVLDRAVLNRAAGDCDIELEQLDVTSDDAGEKIRELLLKFGPIYGLVNNAGIAVGGAFEEQSERDVIDQIGTNLLGAMGVTRALMPSMRASGRGRIVNVSGISGLIAFPGLSVYAASKYALEGFSEGLRYEVERFGVEVCLVEPGTHKTPIFFGNQRRGELVDREGPYGDFNERLESLVMKAAESAPGPEVVAGKIAELLSSTAPPFRTLIGGEAKTMAALRRLVPDALFAGAMRRYMGLGSIGEGDGSGRGGQGRM